MDTPQVLIAQEPPKSGFRFPFPKIPLKNLLFISVIIIIPAILLLLNFKLDLKNFRSGQNPPKLIKQGNIADLPKSALATNLSPLFYAELEYNPQSKSVLQHETGKISGELPQLLEFAPAASADKLNYKIETLSDQDKLLHLGWVSLIKEARKTQQGTFRFKITTAYQPNAQVKVYIQGVGPVWMAKIP